MKKICIRKKIKENRTRGTMNSVGNLGTIVEKKFIISAISLNNITNIHTQTLTQICEQTFLN